MDAESVFFRKLGADKINLFVECQSFMKERNIEILCGVGGGA
jgi:hypothetical protein